MISTTTQKTIKPSSAKVATDRGTLREAVHQVELARHCKGLSRRDVARRMDVDLNEVKRQENETTDLRLTELYRWQEALDATLPELLTGDHDPISTPEIDSRRMAKMLNATTEIRKTTNQSQVHRLAQMLLWQLGELSPQMDGLRQWQSGRECVSEASPKPRDDDGPTDWTREVNFTDLESTDFDDE
jgi:transcriptional regulator with XRE-family HTH domain